MKNAGQCSGAIFEERHSLTASNPFLAAQINSAQSSSIIEITDQIIDGITAIRNTRSFHIFIWFELTSNFLPFTVFLLYCSAQKQKKLRSIFRQFCYIKISFINFCLFIKISLYKLTCSGLYRITNSAGCVGSLTLHKNTFKLGDDVTGQFDFTDADVPCVEVRLHFYYMVDFFFYKYVIYTSMEINFDRQQEM